MNDTNQEIQIPLLSGLIFVVLLVVCIGLYAVRLKPMTASLSYILLIISLAVLVIQTGGVNSTFLSIFVASLGFAWFFGIAAGLTALAAFATCILVQSFTGALTIGQIIALGILGGIPLIAGFFVWGRRSTPNPAADANRSYTELASELSEVSGQSEIVINAIGEGVLALDRNGVIKLINPAAEQLLGWNRHDSLNLSYKSVFQMLNTKNQDVEEVNNPVAHALTTNKPSKNDNFSLKTQSGKSFLASISVRPIGQLGSGVIIVFRDITTEKSDERQRAEFISTASHEMRTPVASIEGYLGLALNPATAIIDQKARDFITKAHESAEHLGRLFADLLDVSKADDSRLKNDPHVVDVVPFIHDIVQGLTPKAIEKNLHVFYKPLPDGEPEEHNPIRRINPVFYANVDNDHLREIVQNLVENAIKYTPKGEVVVDVTGDDNHITISIADSGIGIPREDQAHLFQKFYRVDNSDTREIGGTGLGLYLCRRLTETIGGRLWVESEYKKGSTFFVEIPRISHDDAQRMIEQASINVEKEAAQLQTEARYEAPIPVTPELAVPPPLASPAPVNPQPPLTPSAPSGPAPRENTPLSVIEADPDHYTAPRNDLELVVPPREP